jgi:hypothetical protein
VARHFQAKSKSIQIYPNPAKLAQRKSKKKPWISLDSLVRIEPFQWVEPTPRAEFSSHALDRRTSSALETGDMATVTQILFFTKTMHRKMLANIVVGPHSLPQMRTRFIVRPNCPVVDRPSDPDDDERGTGGKRHRGGGWLKSLGLGQYEAAFHDNGVDWDVLPDLTDADLEKLGVLLGHRKRLLKAIAGSEPNDGRVRPPVGRGFGSHSRRGRTSPLTVMFCDLVGSTALAAQLDPEDMRGIIGAYHKCYANLASPPCARLRRVHRRLRHPGPEGGQGAPGGAGVEGGEAGVGRAPARR